MIPTAPSSLIFILKRFRPLHHVCFHDEILTFSLIILDLKQIVSVNLKGLRVIRIDPRKLRPDLIDLFCIVYDVEAKLVKDIKVHHLRVKVRPKLNVVVSALFYLFVQFSIQTLKSDDYGDI